MDNKTLFDLMQSYGQDATAEYIDSCESDIRATMREALLKCDHFIPDFFSECLDNAGTDGCQQMIKWFLRADDDLERMGRESVRNAGDGLNMCYANSLNFNLATLGSEFFSVFKEYVDRLVDENYDEWRLDLIEWAASMYDAKWEDHR